MKPISAAITAIWVGSTCWAEQPLSAIDWLNEVVTIPAVQVNPAAINEPPVSDSALIPEVTVLPLDAPVPDSVGLLPSLTTGFPETLWQASNTQDLTALLARVPDEPLPAVQALLYTLLLAEAQAPVKGNSNARFLKARLKTLVDFGAVEPAEALLERAGPTENSLFDQWFNLTLLTGHEYKACNILRDRPELSDSYAARIYCTAQAGDWSTAALTYETSLALNFLSKTEAELLAQYLDPETIDPTVKITPPSPMTPLTFRLFEAVGTPLPTRGLPRAYAMADLRNTAGWKSEIEAAERLAHTGALPATRLLGLYTERRPAASGGVWDRVSAIQRFDTALNTSAPQDVAATLPEAWQAMRRQGLEVAFAQLFTESLLKLDLPEPTAQLAFKISLLSPQYEEAANAFQSANTNETFLIGLAKGAPDPALAATGLEQAIAKAFANQGPATEHQAMLEAGKLGQAILSAAIGLSQTTSGNLADTTAALSTLRSVGLEDIARRAALQMLTLERADEQ